MRRSRSIINVMEQGSERHRSQERRGRLVMAQPSAVGSEMRRRRASGDNRAGGGGGRGGGLWYSRADD